ncbi:MAG: MerR family transcriptional regulator [Pseudomonadota bacterium]
MSDFDPTQPTASTQDADATAEDLYRIGTVAQLTDISVERLRAWERRYGLAPAHRAGKTRFYSASQLERLHKIKRLIDAGQPISSLAELSDEQLDERQSAVTIAASTAPMVGGQPARTGLIGPNLLVLEQQQEADLRIQIVGRWANLEAFERDQLGVDALDAIVVQLPVLDLAPMAVLADYFPRAERIALYQFATANNLESFAGLGLTALKCPTPWVEIESAVASVHRAANAAENAAPRRFSDEELVAIAASTLADPNGCPGHLVELISQLNAFADYSRSLEAASGGLYDEIHVDTTQARARLERALEALAMAEGLIASPEPQGTQA